jgi:hypothetical protein
MSNPSNSSDILLCVENAEGLTEKLPECVNGLKNHLLKFVNNNNTLFQVQIDNNGTYHAQVAQTPDLSNSCELLEKHVFSYGPSNSLFPGIKQNADGNIEFVNYGLQSLCYALKRAENKIVEALTTTITTTKASTTAHATGFDVVESTLGDEQTSEEQHNAAVEFLLNNATWLVPVLGVSIVGGVVGCITNKCGPTKGWAGKLLSCNTGNKYNADIEKDSTELDALDSVALPTATKESSGFCSDVMSFFTSALSGACNSGNVEDI